MNNNIKNYMLVTGAYWGFTLTDGALRMLVLLYFYSLGYTPFEISLLFLFYEFFGIITNLLGGWIGAKMGLKVTLFSGLALQIIALTLLAFFNPEWSILRSVTYVICSQALSGVAKDLTKLSSKSAIKVVIPKEKTGALFKWVALLTGSKNALKGMGFFLGGVLLNWLEFDGALIVMAVGLSIILFLTVSNLPGNLGQVNKQTKFEQILSKSSDINWLSGARFFLFGSRDIWFVVGLPLFLAGTMNWNHKEVGTYMAIWIIVYGFIQALAPKILNQFGKKPEPKLSRFWISALFLITLSIIFSIQLGTSPNFIIIFGLLLFGFAFAVNSAIHSYLVLAYSKAENVSLNVGFYYMANAGGRLIGTFLSGILYQWGGLVLCLIVSGIFLLLSWSLSLALPNLIKEL